MKLAIVEWEPRLCGAVEWARHFTAGARSAGHDVDLITASKSGKWLKSWPDTMRNEFVVLKVKDLVDVLNVYDLVILSDIACWSAKIVSPRNPGVPWFIDVLHSLKVPFTAMYHGGTYPTKLDPTLVETAQCQAFSNVLLTTREPYARERLAKVEGYETVTYISHPYLPVDINLTGVNIGKRKRKALLMTARIAVNKGQNLAMWLAAQDQFKLEMWGYNSFGLPSIGYRLWELGKALGLKPTQKKPSLPRNKQNIKHPNAYKFYTGAFEFTGEGKTSVKYNDEYHQLDEVDWSPAIHLSLPSAAFGGSLEYVTLEAILNGCVAVVPEVAIELPRYGGYMPVVTVPMTKVTVWPTKDLKDIRLNTKDDLGAIERVIYYLYKEPLAKLAEINMSQFQVITKYHSAKKIARKLIKELEKVI